MCASLPSSLLRRAAALVLAAALVCPVLPQAFAAETFPWSGITYIVTRLEDDPLLIDGSGPAPDLAGYPLTILQNGRSRDLATAARQELTIHHEGQTFTDDSKLEPITGTLRRLGIQPSPIEGVLIQISRGSIEITVASDLVYWERDAVETPYQTIRRANPAMAKGEEDVVQVGSIGEKGGVYEVVWSNGAELSRQLVEELDSEPVDEIIEYGTAVKPAAARPAQAASVSVSRDAESSGESGTLTLSNGETLRFSKAISMTATAYTAGHGGVGTRTASGTGGGPPGNSPGNQTVYCRQRRRRIRPRRGGGYRSPGEPHRPLLRHLPGMHQFWAAGLHGLYFGINRVEAALLSLSDIR